MKNKGFTFIEVLVVVTIIAVLTMIGATNFRVANKKARDGKRKGDLEQIRAALEIYYTNENVYPVTLSVLETEGYINKVPSDPISTQNYSYTRAIATTYALCAYLELETNTVTGCGDCGDSDCNYKVVNPL